MIIVTRWNRASTVWTGTVFRACLAGGAAGAAAARAGVNVIPLSDWSMQTAEPHVGPGGYCLALLATHRMSSHSREEGSLCGE